MRTDPASPRTSVVRWLVPVAAAAGVAALFLGLAVLVHPSSAGPGPDQDLRLGRESPVTPSLPPDPADLGRPDGDIEITGYQSAGRTLSLFYDVNVRGCAGQIDPPRVLENARSVVVEIRRRRSASSLQACGNLLLQDSVQVRLDRPLGGRLVRDGGRRMALVPPKASVP
jgi:hypothetical protein